MRISSLTLSHSTFTISFDKNTAVCSHAWRICNYYIIEFSMLNSFLSQNTDQKSYFSHSHESGKYQLESKDKKTHSKI